MVNLRYINDPRPARAKRSATTQSEPRALRFPGGVREVLTRPDPRVMNHHELAQSIDKTLDRMQSALDALAGDVDASYKLSEFRGDNDPNSAA